MKDGTYNVAVCVFLELLSFYIYSSFPLGFEGGVWDLIV